MAVAGLPTTVLCGRPVTGCLLTVLSAVTAVATVCMCLTFHPAHASKRHSNLFCSLAILDPTVGHTMDILPAFSPFSFVLCHSERFFHTESCPRLGVVYPGHAWSSSPACTWYWSLHYLFLQAIPLFPHDMTNASFLV